MLVSTDNQKEQFRNTEIKASPTQPAAFTYTCDAHHVAAARRGANVDEQGLALLQRVNFIVAVLAGAHHAA